jgi:hypothetical protein
MPPRRSGRPASCRAKRACGPPQDGRVPNTQQRTLHGFDTGQPTSEPRASASHPPPHDTWPPGRQTRYSTPIWSPASQLGCPHVFRTTGGYTDARVTSNRPGWQMLGCPGRPSASSSDQRSCHPHGAAPFKRSPRCLTPPTGRASGLGCRGCAPTRTTSRPPRLSPRRPPMHPSGRHTHHALTC